MVNKRGSTVKKDWEPLLKLIFLRAVHLMGMNHSKCAYLAILDGRSSDLHWHITKGAEVSRIDPATGHSLMHVAAERGGRTLRRADQPELAGPIPQPSRQGREHTSERGRLLEPPRSGPLPALSGCGPKLR